MLRTVEAIVDEHGTVRLLETVHLPQARRALLTIYAQSDNHANIVAMLKKAGAKK